MSLNSSFLVGRKKMVGAYLCFKIILKTRKYVKIGGIYYPIFITVCCFTFEKFKVCFLTLISFFCLLKSRLWVSFYVSFSSCHFIFILTFMWQRQRLWAIVCFGLTINRCKISFCVSLRKYLGFCAFGRQQ